MNSLSDKPGVIGAIGTLGQAATQSVKQEVKKTIENSAEQLGMKERKEGAPDAAALAQQEALKKQQSQEAVSWLYGTSSSENVPQTPKNARKKTGECDCGC